MQLNEECSSIIFFFQNNIKIKEVMMRHRVNMESSGYMPSDGETFPDDPLLRESLSLILENSCLLCDIILR